MRLHKSFLLTESGSQPISGYDIIQNFINLCLSLIVNEKYIKHIYYFVAAICTTIKSLQYNKEHFKTWQSYTNCMYTLLWDFIKKPLIKSYIVNQWQSMITLINDYDILKFFSWPSVIMFDWPIFVYSHGKVL